MKKFVSDKSVVNGSKIQRSKLKETPSTRRPPSKAMITQTTCRLDKTHHPFCTKFAAGDVRITTRVRENTPAQRSLVDSALNASG
jgi:Zn-dependent M32 family carboxypeptidase